MAIKRVVFVGEKRPPRRKIQHREQGKHRENPAKHLFLSVKRGPTLFSFHLCILFYFRTNCVFPHYFRLICGNPILFSYEVCNPILFSSEVWIPILFSLDLCTMPTLFSCEVCIPTLFSHELWISTPKLKKGEREIQ